MEGRRKGGGPRGPSRWANAGGFCAWPYGPAARGVLSSGRASDDLMTMNEAPEHARDLGTAANALAPAVRARAERRARQGEAGRRPCQDGARAIARARKTRGTRESGPVSPNRAGESWLQAPKRIRNRNVAPARRAASRGKSNDCLWINARRSFSSCSKVSATTKRRRSSAFPAAAFLRGWCEHGATLAGGEKARSAIPYLRVVK